MCAVVEPIHGRIPVGLIFRIYLQIVAGMIAVISDIPTRTDELLKLFCMGSKTRLNFRCISTTWTS
jgi:hypothetical protein